MPIGCPRNNEPLPAVVAMKVGAGRLLFIAEQAIFALGGLALMSVLAHHVSMAQFGQYATGQGLVVGLTFLIGALVTYPLLFTAASRHRAHGIIPGLVFARSGASVAGVAGALLMAVLLWPADPWLAMGMGLWLLGWAAYELTRRLAFLAGRSGLLLVCSAGIFTAPVLLVLSGLLPAEHCLPLALGLTGALFAAMHVATWRAISTAPWFTMPWWPWWSGRRARWHARHARDLVAPKLLQLAPLILIPWLLAHAASPAEAARWQAALMLASLPMPVVYVLGTAMVRDLALPGGARPMTVAIRYAALGIVPFVLIMPFSGALAALLLGSRYATQQDTAALSLAAGLAAAMVHLQMCFLLGVRRPGAAWQVSLVGCVLLAILAVAALATGWRLDYQAALWCWIAASAATLLAGLTAHQVSRRSCL